MPARAPLPGYVPPSPTPDALVRWPEAFGTRFTLFVDTEEEFDWSAPLSRRARAVTAIAALPEAHRRLQAAGVPITYMVDHPVATDARAAALVGEALAMGGASVGTQLHPWVNPPFADLPAPDRGFPGALPRSLEAAKLDVLTTAIKRSFGTRPVAYRAGRYGIGPSTAALLAERGYRLDSSMRSRYSYAGEGGPDFTGIRPHAFHLAPGLIELPLTTVFTGRARERGASLYGLAGKVPRLRGAFARAGLVSRVSLTPEGMPLADALEAARIAVGEGVRVLNFSFHSPTLVPGHTPYARDAGEVIAFWRWWDAVLAELARLGVRAASLDEVIAAAGASALPGDARGGL